MEFEEAKAHYVELVATNHEAQLKGAKMPYTSMNGNMYSYLGDNGVALRLPAGVREEFLAKYETTLYHTYGTTRTASSRRNTSRCPPSCS